MKKDNNINNFVNENGIMKWQIDDNLVMYYNNEIKESVYGNTNYVNMALCSMDSNSQTTTINVDIHKILNGAPKTDEFKDEINVAISKEDIDGKILSLHNLSIEPVMFRTVLTTFSSENMDRNVIYSKKTSLKDQMDIILRFINSTDDINKNMSMQKGLKVFIPTMEDTLKSTLYQKKKSKTRK